MTEKTRDWYWWSPIRPRFDIIYTNKERKMSLWTLLFVVLFQIGVMQCAVKTWTTNMNFDNVNNWDLKRIPCGRDRVIFPADDDVTVYMPKSLVVNELILPNNGVFIFPTDGSLVVDNDVSVQACPGQDIKFTGGQRQDRWYDPYNWNITSPLAINLAGDKDLLPVPHSDQVPCESDDVVFPTEASFKLYFDGGSLNVGSIMINGVAYRTEEFRTLASSDTGKALFVNPPEMTIRSQTCSTPSGCPCGNDQPQIMSKICSIVAPKCPKLQCSDPIQVTGHCCPMCGSRLLIEYREGFSINVFTRLYFSYLIQSEYRLVQAYSSKTHDNKIQLIFVDAGRNKGSAHKLARDIHIYLKQDIEDQQIYNLKSINFQSTTNWLASSDVVTHSPLSGKSGTASGTVVGIIFALLALIALCVLLYMFYRKRRIPGFAFARFDSGGSKIEMELGTTPHDMLDPVASSSSSPEPGGKGFDNPMYEKSMFSLTNPTYNTLKETEKKSIDYRENPTFMVLDDADQ